MPTHHYENWDWDYQSALDWMDKAKTRCIDTGETSLAIGSHSHNIVTLGRHASPHEIVDPSYLQDHGVQVFHIDRGGGATLHGPGQVVAYPIMSLARYHGSIPLVTAHLEDVLMACLREFKIESHKLETQPGVFVNGAKIGSIGFRVSQNVTTHGISLNVANDLSLYSKIATCGKVNATITSMAALLGESLNVRSIGHRLGELLSYN